MLCRIGSWTWSLVFYQGEKGEDRALCCVSARLCLGRENYISAVVDKRGVEIFLVLGCPLPFSAAPPCLPPPLPLDGQKFNW